MSKQNFQVDVTSEAWRVAKQLERVNDALSSFGMGPDAVDAKIHEYSYVAMAHGGKRIALSIMALEAMVAGKLKAIGFYNNKEIQKAKADAFYPITITVGTRTMPGSSVPMPIRRTIRKYLSEDSDLQMDGLECLAGYYSYLYDSITSLPEFASALRVSSSDNEEEVIDEVDETEVS